MASGCECPVSYEPRDPSFSKKTFHGENGPPFSESDFPTNLNARPIPSGGGRPGYNAAQRTRGPGGTSTGTNKTNSKSEGLPGCSRGATGKLRARAPARAQTGLLYIEPLVCLWGLRAVKNARDRAFAARAVVSKIRTGAWEIQPDSEFGILPSPHLCETV